MPASVTKYRIKDLTTITKSSDLLDKIIEVETGSGTDQNSQVSVPLLVQTIANNLPAPQKVSYISVRTYDTTDPQYLPGYATLVSESLSRDLVMWMTARVEFPNNPSKFYRLTYNQTGTGKFFAYVDTTFTGNKLSCDWVEIDSPDDRASNVPDFNALSAYSKDDSVKYRVGGSLRIFVAKQDLVLTAFPPSSQVPAPTGLATDAYWTEINSELAPNFSRLGQLECRYYYNNERDIYGGDTVEDLITRENAGAGILYTKRQVTVELGPNAGTYEVAYDSATPQFQAYVDGSFAGGTNPCKFIKVEQLIDDSNYAKLNVVNNYTAQQVIRLPGSNYESSLYSNSFSIRHDNLGGVIVRGNPVTDETGLVQLALQLDAPHVQVTHEPTLPFDITTKNYVDKAVGGINGNGVKDWLPGAQNYNSLVLYNGNVYRVKQDIANGQVAPENNTQYYQLLVDGASVQAAVVAIQSQITTEKERMDNLVANAPQALDTLKEIADQLAADEAGAAAMLATQQQHTQQLNNVVHLSGDESIAGMKTFTQPVSIGTTSGSNSLNVWSSATDTNVFIASLLAPNVRDNIFLTIGRQAGANGQSALFGFSQENGIPAAFFTIYGRPASDFKILGTGSIGIGTSNPVERLEVVGNVKASGFVGDGSRLTNLPNTLTVEQDITNTSTTTVPSVAAVSDYVYPLYEVAGINFAKRNYYSSGKPNVSITNATTAVFGDGSVYTFNVTLPIAELAVGGLNNPIAFAICMPANRSGVNTLNFVNGVIDGKSSIRLMAGDWLIVGREKLSGKAPNYTSQAYFSQVIAGNSNSLSANSFVSNDIKSTVKAGTFTNGELQGTQPNGSFANQKFADANYFYQYTLSMADIDGTNFVWVRTVKA